MALPLEKIREEITAPSKSAVLTRARYHQSRLRFHAQTYVSANLGRPTQDFLAFVRNLLPADKFEMFKTLFRFPVKTNEITDVCFDKLSRVFDGRNPAYNYQFMSTEERDDWEWYRAEVLKEPEIWSTRGWEFFKTEINSVLVVDMPTEQAAGDRYPAPYFYWLPLEHIIAYDTDETGAMRWIIFRQRGGNIAVIDDECYRLYQSGNGDRIDENAAPLLERPHGLGYCPARFFWDEPLNIQEPDIKASPLTKSLDSLDWFLFFHISKRHLDLYAAYPIYSGYEQSCDYSNDDEECDHGLMRNRKSRQYVFDAAGLPKKCPKCGDKRIAGVGSFVEVPIPTESQPDLHNPVQMLTVDRQSLDYNVSEEVRMRNDIIAAVVGTSEDVAAREALNETQIQATFESQTTVIHRVKRGFESAQEFVDSTICRLRYGEAFVSASINMGTEFYIFDTADARARYATAKENGASEAELDALHTAIIESEYRNNPTQVARMQTLAELEPYRHLTRDEIIDLHSRGLVSDADLRIKLDFANLVRRFERENANILEFGTEIPYDEKIRIIHNKFRDYVSENR